MSWADDEEVNFANEWEEEEEVPVAEDGAGTGAAESSVVQSLEGPVVAEGGG